MSGQTDISTTTTATTTTINSSEAATEGEVISSPIFTQTGQTQAKISTDQSSGNYGKSVNSDQPSKNVAKPETLTKNMMTETLAKKPEKLAKNMISGKLFVKKPETPVKNLTAEDMAILKDVHDTVESLVSTVSDQNPHPPSVVRISDDQQIPEDVLKLINRKSPDEVVSIINGQLAELKAIETLRDVEEECLDEITNDIMAKITKDNIV